MTLLLPVMWAGKTNQRRMAAEMVERERQDSVCYRHVDNLLLLLDSGVISIDV